MELDLREEFFYLLPGFSGGCVYWWIWPVRRRPLDFAFMGGFLALGCLAFGHMFGQTLVTIAGSSYFLGAWGDDYLLAARCVIGILLGIWLGLEGRHRGPGYYPFSPLMIR
ncbi:MAG: hypothetical protein J7598_17650 [Mitsuaria chitosanitabida]|uniref:hypothetical protein n=1 Tax=Roseateles chitosanitabidus TaxID=65048 RepID=UPI001B070C68|nr:hypothetical protein [Roseateles chitosanitabidus]MBO9688433.1 hypothetical protein [Roseateles chitosanitabidus]